MLFRSACVTSLCSAEPAPKQPTARVWANWSPALADEPALSIQRHQDSLASSVWHMASPTATINPRTSPETPQSLSPRSVLQMARQYAWSTGHTPGQTPHLSRPTSPKAAELSQHTFPALPAKGALPIAALTVNDVIGGQQVHPKPASVHCRQQPSDDRPLHACWLLGCCGLSSMALRSYQALALRPPGVPRPASCMKPHCQTRAGRSRAQTCPLPQVGPVKLCGAALQLPGLHSRHSWSGAFSSSPLQQPSLAEQPVLPTTPEKVAAMWPDTFKVRTLSSVDVINWPPAADCCI